jgi:acetyl esterase
MLHPVLRSISTAAREASLPPLRTLAPAAARVRIAALRRAAPGVLASVVVEDLIIDGVRVRSYRPAAVEPPATVVYLHSGGWVLGGLDAPDPMLRRMTAETGLRYLSVDYRLAPEHPFPGALEDVATVLQHLTAQAVPFVLHGDSAGANLAAVAAASYRDDARLLMLLLVYPVTDCDLTRPSYRQAVPEGFLEVKDMEWFWSLYAGDRDRSDPALSPLRGDLAGLPPTLVVTAEYDPLRDEGIEYARKAAAAGVAVTHWHIDDCAHGFIQMTGMLDRADQTIDRMAAVVRRVVGGQ